MIALSCCAIICNAQAPLIFSEGAEVYNPFAHERTEDILQLENNSLVVAINRSVLIYPEHLADNMIYLINADLTVQDSLNLVNEDFPEGRFHLAEGRLFNSPFAQDEFIYTGILFKSGNTVNGLDSTYDVFLDTTYVFQFQLSETLEIVNSKFAPVRTFNHYLRDIVYLEEQGRFVFSLRANPDFYSYGIISVDVNLNDPQASEYRPLPDLFSWNYGRHVPIHYDPLEEQIVIRKEHETLDRFALSDLSFVGELHMPEVDFGGPELGSDRTSGWLSTDSSFFSSSFGFGGPDNNMYSPYILHIGNDGTLHDQLWYAMEDTVTYGTGRTLAWSNDGNILIASQLKPSWPPNLNYPPFLRLVKSDLDGNIIWQKVFGEGDVDYYVQKVIGLSNGGAAVLADRRPIPNSDSLVTTAVYILDEFGNVVTDIPEFQQASPFYLHPNPTVDFLEIRSESIFTEAAIYDLSGNLLRKVDVRSRIIDVSDLLPGMYLLGLMTKDKLMSYERFVKH